MVVARSIKVVLNNGKRNLQEGTLHRRSNPGNLINISTVHYNNNGDNFDEHSGNRSRNNSSSVLAGDLPSGLKVTQWNIQSIAPTENNHKLEEIKLILNKPGKETHILGIT